MGCEFELFEGKVYIRRRSYRLKMNLKNVVETVIYLFIFFLVYKLDLAVGFFEIFGKNFSLLYHWILFIACLHDNIRVSMRQECRIIKFFLIIDYPDNR